MLRENRWTIINNYIMFIYRIHILLYPKGVYNVKLGLTVQENEDVADGTLDHIGRAQAMGNGCGWRRGKWRGC